MTGGRFFGESSGIDPATEGQIADRLRLALRDHADAVEPAPNSYLTLAARMEQAEAPGSEPGHRRDRRTLAAAAVILALAGAGVYALIQDGAGDVTAVRNTDSTTVPTIAPAVTTTVAVPTTTATSTTTSTTLSEASGPAAAAIPAADLPRTASVDTAVFSFLHLIGLPGETELSSSDGVATLISPANGAVLGQVFTNFSATGVAVSSATSESVRIDAVDIDDGELVVRGRATAFEAVLGVQLVGTDGARLASTTTTAGCCEELVEFEARLPLAGVGEAFVVASGDNAGSGVLPPFAALPIRFDVSEDPHTYTVFRIHPDDDADQGLNVRDLPGTDEGTVLVTLPPGQPGIRRLPRMPALVGDSFWWQIETAEGTVGWVNSAYLTPSGGELGDDELVALARSAIGGLDGAEVGGLHWLGLSRRVPVALGWIGQPRSVSGPAATDVPYWTDARLWPVPEATYGEAEKLISLRSLLHLPDPDSDPEIIPGAALRYGFEERMAAAYFAGTQSVTVVGPAVDGEPDRSTILFYEVGPTGPELVGAVASVFVP